MVTSREQAEQALGRLRNQYPNLFTGDEQQWRQRVADYIAKLRRFGVDIIVAACDRAVEAHPDRFPTTGQLIVLCKAEMAERNERQREEERRRWQRQQERYAAAERSELAHEIPTGHEEQQRWAEQKAALSKWPAWEFLACQWEIDSVRRGLDPNKTCPEDVAEKRFEQFWKTWQMVHEDLARE